MAKRNSLVGNKRLQDQMEKFYKQGNSIQSLADEFQLSFGVVRHFLTKRNLTRPRGHKVLNKSSRSQSEEAPPVHPASKARSTFRDRNLVNRLPNGGRSSKVTLGTSTHHDGVVTKKATVGATENDRHSSTSGNGRSRNRESQDAISLTEYQADYEEFVKAFAVPTHLYRYLANRSHCRPLYLNRNLSYMRVPRSRFYHPTTKKRTLDEVVSDIFSSAHINQSEKQNGYLHSFPSGQSPSRALNRGRMIGVSSISESGSQHQSRSYESCSHAWPDELELVLEGFFDSEKENDWVTVEAKLSVQSRFGWTRMRKSLQRDTIVLLGWDLSVECNNNQYAKGTGSPPPPSSYRFRLAELLDAARRSRGEVGSRRLNTGQLELRIRAKEKRRSNRINGCTVDSLSQSSYLVQYSTAPLPLFYTDVSIDDCPLLLSPGLYELRLGIETESVDFAQAELLNGDGSKSKLTCVAAQSTMFVDGAAPGQLDWCRVRFPKVSAAVDEYARWPRLRFRVIWHSNPPSSCPSLPSGIISPTSLKSPRSRQNGGINRLEGVNVSPRGSFPANKAAQKSPQSLLSAPMPDVIHPTLLKSTYKFSAKEIRTPVPSSPIFVTYRFIYGKGLQQWSETQDLICPWCKLDCRRDQSSIPSALLAHLRTCHPRFRFKANWSPQRLHLSLEVSLNESYDGSNDCGMRRWNVASRHVDTAVDLSVAVKADKMLSDSHKSGYNNNPLPVVGGWTGLLSRPEDSTGNRSKTTTDIVKLKKPSRRLPYSHLIYWRGADRMVQQSLDPTISVRPLAVGHNRVYYHTSTMTPIVAAIFDEDSESEDAPEWLMQHYHRKVEEFTDVNQGEKQLMQTWNSFLLSVKPNESVVCDNQMENLVLSFVTICSKWLHQQNLRKNLILHLTNLIDYGIVEPELMIRAIAVFDAAKALTTFTSN